MMKRIALGILVIGVLLSACTGDAAGESVGIDAEVEWGRALNFGSASRRKACQGVPARARATSS